MTNRGVGTVTLFLAGLILSVFAPQTLVQPDGSGVATVWAAPQSGNPAAQRTADEAPRNSAARAGTAAAIRITPRNTTIAAGDTVKFQIEIQDSVGVRTSLPVDRDFALTSGATALASDMNLAPADRSWEFFDSTGTPIDILTLSAGTEVGELWWSSSLYSRAREKSLSSPGGEHIMT